MRDYVAEYAVADGIVRVFLETFAPGAESGPLLIGLEHPNGGVEYPSIPTVSDRSEAMNEIRKEFHGHDLRFCV